MFSTILNVILGLVLKPKVIIGVLGLAFTLYSINYYKRSQQKIEDLKRNNVELAALVERKEKELKQVDTDIIDSKRELDNYRQVTQQLDERGKKLDEVLFRQQKGKTPVERLATAHSDMIEKTINNATGKAFRCTEMMTGAKGKQNENLGTSCVSVLPESQRVSGSQPKTP